MGRGGGGKERVRVLSFDFNVPSTGERRGRGEKEGGREGGREGEIVLYLKAPFCSLTSCRSTGSGWQ